MQRSIIAPAERVTNLRWGIALLLGAGVLVGSLDRTILSVFMYPLVRAFDVTDATFGSLLLVFGLAYVIGQVPLGALLDRYGVTAFGRISSFCWSIVALFGAAYGGSGGGLGLADAPAFQVAAKATAYWFPASERGLSTAIFDAAAKVAVAIGLLLTPLMLANDGWRPACITAAIVSFLFFAAFFVFYRDPAEHAGLTHAEGRYLAGGGARGEGRPAPGALFALLREPKMWLLPAGFAAYAYSFAVLLQFMPAFLQHTFELPIPRSGISAAIPWLIAAIAELLVGGVLVDTLIKRGLNAARVRGNVLAIGMLLGLCVFGATATRDSSVASVYIGLALCGLAVAAPVVWSMPALLAPRGAVGSVAAIMNLAGILALFAEQFVAGYFLAAGVNYTVLFISTGAVLAVGILSYIFLLTRSEPLGETG